MWYVFFLSPVDCGVGDKVKEADLQKKNTVWLCLILIPKQQNSGLFLHKSGNLTQVLQKCNMSANHFPAPDHTFKVFQTENLLAYSE